MSILSDLWYFMFKLAPPPSPLPPPDTSEEAEEDFVTLHTVAHLSKHLDDTDVICRSQDRKGCTHYSRILNKLVMNKFASYRKDPVRACTIKLNFKLKWFIFVLEEINVELICFI
jgi:hypothetical protein